MVWTAIHRGEDEEGGGQNWEMIGGQEQDLETASPRLEDVEEVCAIWGSVMPCRRLYKKPLPGSMITCSTRNEAGHCCITADREERINRRDVDRPSHPSRVNGSFVIGCLGHDTYDLGMLPFTKTQLNSASDVAGTYNVRFAKLFFFLILCSPCHSIRALITCI